MNMQGNLGRNIAALQAAPQGIAALQGMQRPQQPQQQGPQGLQNIPPDLMRALGVRAALEAEEKAKQQIAAMTEQALNYQIPQTSIAEQDFEKLKSEELAKMTGQIGNQQAAKQQQAMQQLMAGIARAPGAGQVMPARMASGGIVAFQNRGEVPPVVDPREVQRILRKSPMARTPEENEILRQAGVKLEQRRMGPEGVVQRAERGLQQIGPAARQYLTEGAAGLSPEELEQRGDTGATTEKLYRMLGGQQVKPPAPGMSESDLQDLMPTRQPLPQTPLPPEMGVGQPQAPAMRMPPAQVRSKVPAGVAGAVQQPVVRPDSTGQGISPPQQVAQQAAPSFTQDLMEGLSKYQTQEFKNVSELAKELYALPPEVRQIYEQRLAQAKQAAQPAPQDFAGRFAKLGGYGPAKGIASAYNQMMSDERAQQEKLRAGVTSAEDALIRAQEAARLKSAETAFGARGKAAETFGNIAGITSQAQTAAMNRELTASIENARNALTEKQIDVQRISAMRPTEVQQMAELYENNPEVFKARFGDKEEALMVQLRKSYDDYIVKLPIGAPQITFKQYVAQFKEAGKKGPALGTRENPIKLD